MEMKIRRPNATISIKSNVLDQLKIIERETGCTHSQMISCLLYNIGVHQGFLSLPPRICFREFKNYVKQLRKQKKMQLNKEN